jgi:hypothetical protein
MRNYKKLGKLNQKETQHRIYIVEELRLQDGITLPAWFNISKTQLTDLVQVGSVIMDKIDMTITIDMIECYQEVHVWKSVEKENHPQDLEGITAQEALSYTTGIQIMEETMGSFDENGDALEFTMAMTQDDANAQLEIECSAELDNAWANESI